MRKIPRQISDRLPAAADLFAEKGLNDSKIEDVAAVTGVPKATLYYYFAGKEDILAFLLEDLLKDIFDAVTAIVHTGGTGAERLELVIRPVDLVDQQQRAGGIAQPGCLYLDFSSLINLLTVVFRGEL